MLRIERVLRNHVCPGIVQFSPVRSGSTLVWNALRSLLPNQEVPKRHDLNLALRCPWNPCRIISTVRDPRDMIVSMIRIAKDEVTAESIRRNLDLLHRNGLRDLVRIHDRPRTLILRYEDFYRDFEYLFDRLGAFLGLRYEASVKDQFATTFDAASIHKKGQLLSDFSNFDHRDHVHGDHVSKDLGAPGSYKRVLNDDQRRLIEHSTTDVMKLFGYDSSKCELEP